MAGVSIIIAPRAKKQLDAQILYLQQHAPAIVAESTVNKIHDCLYRQIAYTPEIGVFDRHKQIYTKAVVKTKYLVMYQFDKQRQRIRVLGFFHTSQDRSHFTVQDGNLQPQDWILQDTAIDRQHMLYTLNAKVQQLPEQQQQDLLDWLTVYVQAHSIPTQN